MCAVDHVVRVQVAIWFSKGTLRLRMSVTVAAKARSLQGAAHRQGDRLAPRLKLLAADEAQWVQGRTKAAVRV